MSEWREDVWYWDTEVFPHRWLFNALSVKGERVSFSNDREGLKNWIDHVKPLLVGYNSKHYDNYVLKAIFARSTPEEVKEISDAIVVDGIQGWEIDMGWIKLPDSVDLMLDLPTFPSLKSIEGNFKMSIEESDVAFNAESMTDSEWQEVVDYCWHDVESLVPLYEARKDYLEAKETLALMLQPPLDVRKALNMTNAKLVARFLGANMIDRNDERQYTYPTNLKKELIPPEVFTFFDRLPNSDISLNVLFGKKEEPDGEEKE